MVKKKIKVKRHLRRTKKKIVPVRRHRRKKVRLKLSNKKKDSLGISFNWSKEKRRKVLKEKAKKLGERSIAGKLRAIQVLNKNRNPELSKKAAEDAKYVFGAFKNKKFVGKGKGYSQKKE